MEIPTGALEELEAYLLLLLRWNEKLNLTGLSTLEDVIDRLLIEAVAAATVVPAASADLIDLGSGGGSPAIPLKIVRPELRVWMVESKGRKAAFLRECVRSLRLENVVVENTRAEELLTRPDLTESMEYVSVRAVRLDGSFLNTAQAFAKPGGSILLFGTRQTGEDVRSRGLGEVIQERILVEGAGSHMIVVKKAGFAA